MAAELKIECSKHSYRAHATRPHFHRKPLGGLREAKSVPVLRWTDRAVRFGLWSWRRSCGRSQGVAFPRPVLRPVGHRSGPSNV